MEHLRELVLDYSDEKLLEVYRIRHSDYTEEAIKIIVAEVEKRGLTANVATQERTELVGKLADVAVSTLKQEDFIPLPHLFTKADVLVANAILRDSKVPYIIETYGTAAKRQETFELLVANFKDAVSHGSNWSIVKEKHNGELFVILAYNDALTTALELIEEHFEAGSGMYIRRLADIIDRLTTFNLSDISFSPKVAEEELDVSFADAEKKEIIKLAELMLDEADTIENEQGRAIFYYDTLEPLIGKLNGKSGFTRMEFLAIIELCQIYCNDSHYNPILNQTVSSILDFFLS